MTILLLALQWSSFFIMVMLMVGTLKHKDVLAHIIKLKFRVMLVTLRIEIYQVASCSPRLCYLYKIRSTIVTLLLG